MEASLASRSANRDSLADGRNARRGGVGFKQAELIKWARALNGTRDKPLTQRRNQNILAAVQEHQSVPRG